MSDALRRGVTLIELLVALAILGALATVAVPALPSAALRDDERYRRAMLRVRAASAAAGRAVSDSIDSKGRRELVTAWPNGLVLHQSLNVASRGVEVRDAR